MNKITIDKENNRIIIEEPDIAILVFITSIIADRELVTRPRKTFKERLAEEMEKTKVK